VRRITRLAGACLAGATLIAASSASATSSMLFGFGARSTALSQSDLADPASVTGAITSPAALADPGTRLMIGYGHGFTSLTFNGAGAGVRDIGGTDIAFQVGGRAWGAILGGGLSLHLPDRSLMSIGFVPGSEPQFVRFEPTAHRVEADMAVAVKLDRFALGAGVSTLVNAGGDGVAFRLAQDGGGTYADGKADVTLPYHFAPIASASVDLGPAAIAMRYRGSLSLDLDLATRADIDVTGNPLNGTTLVRASGASGYVPATLDFGARWSVGKWMKAMASLQYARWSAAPSPAADLRMDVGLGMTPGILEGSFANPRYRDTLSPRIGLELMPLQKREQLALRAGYMLSPSPVPQPSGFATPADAAMHGLSLGAGWDFGRVWGVQLRADAAATLMLLPERAFDKPHELLPFAHYTAGGHIVHTALSLEGAWR